jgi:hypothetical protein
MCVGYMLMLTIVGGVSNVTSSTATSRSTHTNLLVQQLLRSLWRLLKRTHAAGGLIQTQRQPAPLHGPSSPPLLLKHPGGSC